MKRRGDLIVAFRQRVPEAVPGAVGQVIARLQQRELALHVERLLGLEPRLHLLERLVGTWTAGTLAAEYLLLLGAAALADIPS